MAGFLYILIVCNTFSNAASDVSSSSVIKDKRNLHTNTFLTHRDTFSVRNMSERLIKLGWGLVHPTHSAVHSQREE